jgi:anti-sigma B factor antagonist
VAAEQFSVSVVAGVVHVEGEIDSYVAPAFDEQLVALNAASIDLSGVTFMDSSGVTVLVRHHRREAENGDSLRVVAMSRPVRRILEISGLLRMFTDEPPLCPSTTS